MALLVDTAPQFAELSRIAGVLQEAGWDITFIFDRAYGALDRNIADCRKAGYRVVLPPRQRTLLATTRAWLSAQKQKLKQAAAAIVRRDRRPPKTPRVKPAAQPRTIRKDSNRFVIEGVTRSWIWEEFRQPGGVMRKMLNLPRRVATYLAFAWIPYKSRAFQHWISQTGRSVQPSLARGSILLVNTALLAIRLRRLRSREQELTGSEETLTDIPGFHGWVPDAVLTPEQSAVGNEMVRIGQQILTNQELLSERRIELLILAKDCAYYQTPIWVKAAEQLGIGTILIPFDDADTQALAQHRAGHPDHVVDTDYAQDVARRYPGWSLEWEGQTLLLLPPHVVEARAILGLTPPNPWGYNSSLARQILVESEAKREKLIREGASPGQVTATGSVFQDLLARNVENAPVRRRDLLRKLGMKDDKLLLLASVTPDKVTERRVELEFSSYREMLDYWIGRLTEGNRFNVVLCLHPSVKAADVAFLEQHGARVVRKDTASLIPLCDVYVVDCSATSRWALAAGKMVIDYDLYRYNLPFHSGLEGIVHVLDKQGFEDSLKRLARGELDDMRAMVAENAGQHLFGKLDGQAAARIVAACQAVAKTRQAAQAAKDLHGKPLSDRT